jgi:hypothetical protein
MSQVTYSGEEIARLGKAIYQKLHAQLESVDNIGKIVAIDIASGDYEIGDDVLVVSDRLKARTFAIVHLAWDKVRSPSSKDPSSIENRLN